MEIGLKTRGIEQFLPVIAVKFVQNGVWLVTKGAFMVASRLSIIILTFSQNRSYLVNKSTCDMIKFSIVAITFT